MKKISVYVLEQGEGAADKVLTRPYEKLASWLWDHNLEVVNILCEEVDYEEAIKVEDITPFDEVSKSEL